MLNAQYVFSQSANIWYFGNGAGINFTNGYPVAMTDGEVYTNEGCAVACDNYGKLLFYTDGVTVWNQKHDTVKNGINLSGGKSSTQSAVITPMPGNIHKYYIFTVSEQVSEPGFCYSVIDTKADNGKGEVIKKNIRILSPVTEKLTAVKHCNGNDTWVIVHQWNSNSFFAYAVTQKGISEPVISSIGMAHKSYGAPENGEAIGTMKASSDGKKIAVAINKINLSNIQVFDFNNATGKLTSPVSISTEGNAYGISFSPDNKKLYVSFDAGPNGINQYDITAADIRASEMVIVKGDKGRFGALQTGPDGKTYIATASPYLSVIEKPNEKGIACTYREKAVNLKGRYSTFGLPSFPEHQFGSFKLNLGKDTTVCDNKFEIKSNIRSNSYLWSTGEKTSSIIINKPGQYWLTTFNGECTESDTINIALNKTGKLKLELGNDTSFCSDTFTLDAQNAGAKYIWSTGATTQQIKVEESGLYRVSVFDGVCGKSDSINLKFKGEAVFIAVTEFVPNNGGFNERFDYIIENINYFELKISNKRGKTVFKTKDPKEKWRGYYKKKIVPPGTYYWTLKYKNECSPKETLIKNGEVKIIHNNF